MSSPTYSLVGALPSEPRRQDFEKGFAQRMREKFGAFWGARNTICCVDPRDILLSLKEAASLLQYSESYLRRLVKDKKIRHQQPGKNAPIRFRREWLEEFIEATTVEPFCPDVVHPKLRKTRGVDEFDRSVFLN